MKINERSQQIIFLLSNLFFKVVIQHRKNEIDFLKNNYFLENETDTQLYGYAAFLKNIYIYKKWKIDIFWSENEKR